MSALLSRLASSRALTMAFTLAVTPVVAYAQTGTLAGMVTDSAAGENSSSAHPRRESGSPA